MKMETTKCEKCGYLTYVQIDDRKYCETSDPRKSPIVKCLGCGFTLKNCTCNDAK